MVLGTMGLRSSRTVHRHAESLTSSRQARPRTSGTSTVCYPPAVSDVPTLSSSEQKKTVKISHLKKFL